MENLVQNVFELKVLHMKNGNTQMYVDQITKIIQEKQLKFDVKYIIDNTSDTTQSDMIGGHNDNHTYPYIEFEKRLDNIFSIFGTNATSDDDYKNNTITSISNDSKDTTSISIESKDTTSISNDSKDTTSTIPIDTETDTSNDNITAPSDYFSSLVNKLKYDEPIIENDVDTKPDENETNHINNTDNQKYDKYLVDIPSNYQGILIIHITVHMNNNKPIAEGNITQLHDWLGL